MKLENIQNFAILFSFEMKNIVKEINLKKKKLWYEKKNEKLN